MINELASLDPRVALESTARALILSEPMIKSGTDRDDQEWIAANVPPSRQPHLAYRLTWKKLVDDGNPRTASAMRALALSDAEPEIRRMATGGLIYHKSPASLVALRTLSRDADAEVRRRSVVGLSKDLPDTVNDLLAIAEEDDSADCRRQALIGLLFTYNASGPERAPDARIVSLTVDEIRKDQGAGYSLTGGLAHFTGREFKPDKRDPRYHDGHGITELFMSTTVENVLRWHEQENGSKQ